MSKPFKYFLAFTCLFLLTSCGRKEVIQDDTPDLIEYPTYSIDEYNKMDTYVYSETIDNIKYNYTFYFDNDMCVNSKEELVFRDSNSANDFYKDIIDSDDYINVTISGNIVTYYNNPEYFMYMMYPKETLIELLNRQDEIEE